MGDNFFDELFKESNTGYVPPPIDFHQLFASTPPHQQQRMLILIQQFQSNAITLGQFQDATRTMQQEYIIQQKQQQMLQQSPQSLHLPQSERRQPERVHELRKRHPDPIQTQPKRVRVEDGPNSALQSPVAQSAKALSNTFLQDTGKSEQQKSLKPRPNTPQETDMDLGQMMDVTNYAGVDLRVILVYAGRRICIRRIQRFRSTISIQRSSFSKFR